MTSPRLPGVSVKAQLHPGLCSPSSIPTHAVTLARLGIWTCGPAGHQLPPGGSSAAATLQQSPRRCPEVRRAGRETRGVAGVAGSVDLWAWPSSAASPAPRGTGRGIKEEETTSDGNPNLEDTASGCCFFLKPTLPQARTSFSVRITESQTDTGQEETSDWSLELGSGSCSGEGQLCDLGKTDVRLGPQPFHL